MESITAIIGRNPRAVEKLLGPAEYIKVNNNKNVPGHLKAYYQNLDIEIVFIDNVADWITIYDSKNSAIEDFMCLFGLKSVIPIFNLAGTIMYYHMAGLKKVTLYAYKGRIWKLQIKAFTA